MGLFSLFSNNSEKSKEKDFSLIVNQIKSFSSITALMKKKDLNIKINEYIAFRQLSKILSQVPEDQLLNVLTVHLPEHKAEDLQGLVTGLYTHEMIEKFIDLFENGTADPDCNKQFKIVHERNDLGINNLTILDI